MYIKDKKEAKDLPDKQREFYKKLRERYGNKSTQEILNSIRNDLSIRSDIDNFLLDFIDSIDAEKNTIPITIFNDKLTTLESVVKFLKENRVKSYKEIADSINRDERNIWSIYNKSIKKFKQKFEISDSQFYIPLNIFCDDKLSMQESFVFYIKKKFGLY